MALELEPGMDTPAILRRLQESIVELEKPTYKAYTALIKPNGTNEPIVTEIENTLGTINWSRNGFGTFHGAATGLLTNDKTTVICQSVISYGTAIPVLVQLADVQINSIGLIISDLSGTRVDVVTNVPFTLEIKVYN